MNEDFKFVETTIQDVFEDLKENVRKEKPEDVKYLEFGTRDEFEKTE